MDIKPLGEALGGPATPDSEVVMRVESEEDVLYLRGSIRDTYTGAAWTDDSVKSRYLFIDPIRLGVRAEIFETHPENAAAFREVQASIEFLDEGTSTLFVPHRGDGHRSAGFHGHLFQHGGAKSSAARCRGGRRLFVHRASARG